MDPVIGTEQKRGTYWARMKEYFDKHNKSGIECTDRSLWSRWAVISVDCQKWVGIQDSIDVTNPSGTASRDRLNMAQNLFKGEPKRNKKGKMVHGRSFVLAHCYKELEHEEKWKNRDGLDAPRKAKATIDATMPNDDDDEEDDDDDDDEASSDVNRSGAPHSVARTKRPIGKKQAKDKGKKTGDDDKKQAMQDIVNARTEANEEKKVARDKEWAAEERRAAVEERRAASKERKVALEEKKVAMEENIRLMEKEKDLFFINTEKLDERQKEYINLLRDQVLAQKRLMARYMNGELGAPMGGYGGMGGYGATVGGMGASLGGFGGMGSMGGFGATMGGHGASLGSMGASPGGFEGTCGMVAPSSGYGGFGATSSTCGGTGGMSAPMGGFGLMSAPMPPMSGGYRGMSAMGAPPGGFMASMNAPMPPMSGAYGDSTIHTTAV